MPPDVVRLSVVLGGSLAALLVGALVGALPGPPLDDPMRPRWGVSRVVALILTWLGAVEITIPMFPFVVAGPRLRHMGLACFLVPPFFLALGFGIVQSVLIRRGCSRSLAFLPGIALLGALPGGCYMSHMDAVEWGRPLAILPVMLALIGALITGTLWGLRALAFRND